MSEFAQDYEQKTRLLAEIARLEAQLDTVMRACSMSPARMVTLIEAWEPIAAEFLPALAHHYNTEDDQRFLAPMRAAVAAVRPQADALLAELQAARAVVEAARSATDAPLFEHRAPLVKAIAEYDWAVQGARGE